MKLAIDIDDTLCATTLRWMKMFQERFGNPEGCSAEELLERYEIVQRVPYRQTPEAQACIQELLEDDSSWLTIPLLPGAREALHLLAQTADIVYLTSRTECHRFRTMMRLENYDFPAYELLMRPDVVDIMKEDKEQFTRKAHYLLERHPTIVGIIDNSKSLSEELATLDYPGINILYGHPHNADSPATHQLQHRHEIESLLGKGILE